MLSFVLIALVLAGCWPFAALALTKRGAVRPAADARFDAIVVLGCKVLPDGRAGEGLTRRAMLAAELFRGGLAPRIVLSGGHVRGPIAEARAALPVLLSAGVPETAIVLEDRSRSTRENALFSRELVGDVRVLVVTQAYHALRARILFRRVFREVESAGAMSALELGGAYREVPLFVLTRLGLL